MAEVGEGGRGEKARDHARPHAPQDIAVLWQLGWGLGLLAVAAVVLLLPVQPAGDAFLALLSVALVGLIGAFWRPKGLSRVILLALWASAVSVAAVLTGGLASPLAIWCVMPAVTALVIEGALSWAFILSIGALISLTAADLLHFSQSPPTLRLAIGLSLFGVFSTAAAATAAFYVARRRSKAANTEAETELEGFQTLMGDLPELALVMDHQGRARAVFGRPLEGLDAETLHRSLFDAVDPGDRGKLRAAMDEAADHGHATVTFAPAKSAALRISASLQRTVTGDLTVILREMSATFTGPRLFGSGAAQAVGEPLVELSRRVEEAEAGRAKAEADAENRARFLANMSHELRTPLNAIMGFSDIMRNRLFGDLQPRYQEYAELIHDSGGHLLELINDVLDMSKIEAQRYELSLESFDARDPVNAALKLMRLQADDRGVRLRGVIAPEPLQVSADRRAIKQIVLNLVSNALKFTPAGGEVTLTLERVQDALELVVADTGVGIAPEDLARLGRPYQQAGDADARGQGTGLGLSLVRAFTELHGGVMTLESRLGEGTAVILRMPVLSAL